MNKKPLLVLIAGGTCSGKSNLAIKVSELFHDSDFLLVSTDDYVTVKLGNITLGHEETGISENQKRELAENVLLRIKMEYEWTKAKNVNWEKLINHIKEELSEQGSNKVVIV